MSYVTDKRSFWRIARFYFAISLVPFFVIEAVALTPLGDWLFGVMMGASPETTRLAKRQRASWACGFSRIRCATSPPRCA